MSIRFCPYKNKRLFVTFRGKPLETNAVKFMVTKLPKKLPFEFTSHKLRHNFATNYCINSIEKKGLVDIYSLKILLGHSEITTTQKYLHYAQKLMACKNSISHFDSIFFKTP